MPRLLKLLFATCLMSLVVIAGQVSETKRPLSGRGCVNVTSKLKKLTVGKMKVKSCCGGMVLFADVKEENGKKTITGWHLQDSNAKEVKAEKGPDSDGRATIIQAETGNACFVVEQKTN
jgi:hypothetical protein